MELDPHKKRPHLSEAVNRATGQVDPDEMVPGVEYRAGALEDDGPNTPTITLVTGNSTPSFIEDDEPQV